MTTDFCGCLAVIGDIFIFWLLLLSEQSNLFACKTTTEECFTTIET